MRQTFDYLDSEVAPLSNPGKALFLLQGIKHKSNQSIDDRELNTLVYILDTEGVLDFSYHFLFEPDPYSPELYDDLRGLAGVGYVQFNSPVIITEQGSRWVNSLLEQQLELVHLYELILQKVNLLLELDRTTRFELAYGLSKSG